MSTWHIVVGANAVIMAAYLAISWIIFSGLRRTGQVSSNKLAFATSLIFLSCGVHHGSHAVHMLLPTFGIDDAQALALREAWHWPSAWWDVASAGIAAYYLALRGSYGRLLEGPAMFDDYRARERRALEIHDNIVQGLTAVKWSLEAGQPEAAHQSADRTLEQAQKIIGELLDNHPDAAELGPGSLRRDMPAPPMPSGAS